MMLQVQKVRLRAAWERLGSRCVVDPACCSNYFPTCESGGQDITSLPTDAFVEFTAGQAGHATAETWHVIFDTDADQIYCESGTRSYPYRLSGNARIINIDGVPSAGPHCLVADTDGVAGHFREIVLIICCFHVQGQYGNLFYVNGRIIEYFWQRIGTNDYTLIAQTTYLCQISSSPLFGIGWNNPFLISSADVVITA